MTQVLWILFSAGFTYAVCLLTGTLLLRLLHLKLYRSEERFLGFVLGSACLSTFVFLLTAARLARTDVFLALGIVLISLSVWRGAHRPASETLPPAPWPWRIGFALLYGTFTILYLSNALLPEASPDGVAYHVALVARYFREHGFPRITTNMYASLSEGIEMVFLFAFAFGRYTSGAMVHLVYLLVLPFGMMSYARRMRSPVAGVVGGLLFFMSPIVGRTGTYGYIDVAVAAILFATFYAVEIWREQHQGGLLIPIGLLAGFAYAAKYTAFLAVPYALVVIIIDRERSRGLWRPLATVSVCAFAMMAPWLFKNTIVVDNPVSPFANEVFPNRYVYPSFEKQYTQSMRSFNGVQYSAVPLEATTFGGALQGVTGPVFLLTPLILLALRYPMGRRVVPAALLFLCPYLANIGTRFLIPSLPFLSLGLALVFSHGRGMAPAIVMAHALFAWPSFLSLYCHEYAWRIDKMHWNAALRNESEEGYLHRYLGDYQIGLEAEKNIPPGQPIFSVSGMQQAYHSHEVIVGYESALGNRMIDVLQTPVYEHLQPTRRHEFHFSEKRVRRIRVVETARAANSDNWSISELRVLRRNLELPRDSAWRLKASVNPWDVQYAFDNNPITRWNSRKAFEPGMFVQIDFGREEPIDGVTMDCSRDQGEMRMRLEYEGSPGHWETLDNNELISEIPLPARLRRMAIEELEANGIHWILVRDNEDKAKDFVARAAHWGITQIAFDNGYRLYRLD